MYTLISEMAKSSVISLGLIVCLFVAGTIEGVQTQYVSENGTYTMCIIELYQNSVLSSFRSDG